MTVQLNFKEEEFAEERLEETILEYATADADTILTNIIERVEKFAGSLPPHDDATIIVIKRLPNKNPSS